tara:strand:- start:29 stop:331 length:303 start_codon:yes stop_codon:yes gene_type:complete
MEYAEVNGVRYPKVKITWRDIIGAGSFGDADDFRELVCPTFITEGFLFDVFEEDGERYVRTFASYQKEDGDDFGDKNCFPFSVLTSKSRRDVEIALLFMD